MPNRTQDISDYHELDKRLERVERIVGKIDDKLEIILRLDEVVKHHSDGMVRLGKAVDRLEVRIESLDERITSHALTSTEALSRYSAKSDVTEWFMRVVIAGGAVLIYKIIQSGGIING